MSDLTHELVMPSGDLAGEMLRIEFARETLRSNQLLIQLLDQKSYLVLVIMGVTSAAFFSIVGAFLGKIEQLLSPLFVVPLLATIASRVI